MRIQKLPKWIFRFALGMIGGAIACYMFIPFVYSAAENTNEQNGKGSVFTQSLEAMAGEAFYVLPETGSYGNEDGSDWANAFKGFADIAWGSEPGQLGEGDTLYIGGGTYGQGLNIQGGGTATNTLRILRATAQENDTEIGWDPAFDSQVVINSAPGIYPTSYDADHVIIDGKVADGIKIVIPNGNNVYGVSINRPSKHWLFKNIEVAGPSGPEGYPFSGSVRGFHLVDSLAEYITISHCKIHGVSTGIRLSGVSHCTVEYNEIYDIITTRPATEHNNVFYIEGQADNGVFRYNNVYNYSSEGVYWAGPTERDVVGWEVYGNVFHDAPSDCCSRVIEVDLQKYDGGSVNDLYFFNNTVANMWMGITIGSSQIVSGEAYNNIFYNVKANDFNDIAHDYNWSDKDNDEAHGIANGLNPFVDLANKDFRINGYSSAANNGYALTATYNQDMNGNTRGADGGWDIGAYEFTPELNLRGISGNQAIHLNWTVNISLPVTTTWLIDYYTQTTSLPFTVTDPLSTTRSAVLTNNVINYQTYTVTLYAMPDKWLSDTVHVMPTDRFVYLPIIIQ